MIIEAACVDDPQRTHKDGGIARRVERLHGILAAVDAYSYTGLDRRIGIRQVIINKLHRKN